MLRETRPNYTLEIRLAIEPASIEPVVGQRAAFERRALAQDLRRAPEIDIGRRDIVECFVITLAIVVLDKLGNSLFKLPGEIMVLQANHIL